MIKNKKAIIFYPAIIGIVVGLSIYYITVLISKPAIAGLVIGTKSIMLLETSHKAEKIIFYITESAELASKQTIYDLAENKLSNCGEFDEYILLNTEEKDIDECFTNIEDNFQVLFNSNLNDYLSIYPNYKIPLNNYELIISINKKQIIGYATQDIILEASKKDKGIVIEETKGDISTVSVDKEKFTKTKERIETSNYNLTIEKYSKENDVDPDIIRAIITQESVGDKNAKSDSSLGLMQIIPKWHSTTCKKYCSFTNDYSDFFDPEKNICCGTKILKNYYEEGKELKWDCCDKDTCVKAEYSSWTLAVRKYNSQKCIEGADADYVETILGYYELWTGKSFSVKESTKTITKNKILVYSIKPNFKVNLAFDLNTFDKIKSQSKELIQNCSEKKNDELTICIGKKIAGFDLSWELVGEDKTNRKFKFNVDTNKNIFPFENNVIVKFALYFPEP